MCKVSFNINKLPKNPCPQGTDHDLKWNFACKVVSQQEKNLNICQSYMKVVENHALQSVIHSFFIHQLNEDCP